VGEGEIREGVSFDIRFGLEGAVEEGEVIVLRVDDIFSISEGGEIKRAVIKEGVIVFLVGSCG
jgi:hypothetical protein